MIRFPFAPHTKINGKNTCNVLINKNVISHLKLKEDVISGKKNYWWSLNWIKHQNIS